MILAPSLLAANTSCLRSAISDCDAAGCRLIHWDVMDGHFVPNLTFGPPVIADARNLTEIAFDVHLMVTNPAAYPDELAKAGCRYVSFHAETEPHSHRLLHRIKDHGMLAGIALNPQTPPQSLSYLLGSLDFVLVMTVNPGFAGQKFIEDCLTKIDWLSEERERRGLNYQIEVDGGVTIENAPRIADAGADIAVAGKAFFDAQDKPAFTEAIHGLGKNAHPR